MMIGRFQKILYILFYIGGKIILLYMIHPQGKYFWLMENIIYYEYR